MKLVKIILVSCEPRKGVFVRNPNNPEGNDKIPRRKRPKIDYITKFRHRIYRFNEIPIHTIPKVTKYRKTKFRRNKTPTERTAHFFFRPSGSLGEMVKVKSKF
jgi:hypothetical protein